MSGVTHLDSGPQPAVRCQYEGKEQNNNARQKCWKVLSKIMSKNGGDLEILCCSLEMDSHHALPPHRQNIEAYWAVCGSAVPSSEGMEVASLGFT